MSDTPPLKCANSSKFMIKHMLASITTPDTPERPANTDIDLHKSKLTSSVTSSQREQEELLSRTFRDIEQNLSRYKEVKSEEAAVASDASDQKPAHSYVAIIAMAILESDYKKLVLSDIYKYILDKYPYFKDKGQGWRNSVRHNLSLNQCFAKAGRAENGKGNYWTIHPSNLEDFRKGDFRRRLTRRTRRKYFSINGVTCLNPLLSSMSLLKQRNLMSDELFSALFKYNLTNIGMLNTPPQGAMPALPPLKTSALQQALSLLNPNLLSSNSLLSSSSLLNSNLLTSNSFQSLRTPPNSNRGENSTQPSWLP